MATVGDVTAGKAGVQMFVDNTELKSGLDEATKQFDKMNKNINAMRWGQAINQAGVGLQDFVTVLSNGGTWGTAIGAVSNNIIQLVSQINPLYGGVAAVGIAFGQAAMAGYKMLTATKDNTKELEKARKEAEKLAKAKIDAAKAAGEEAAKVRADAGDKDKSQGHIDKAASDVQGKIGTVEELRGKLQEVRNRDTTDNPAARAAQIEEETRLLAGLTDANNELIAAQEKLARVGIEQRSAQKDLLTDAQKKARQDLMVAEQQETAATTGEAPKGWTPAKRKKDQEDARAAVEKAKFDLAEANRQAGFVPGTGAKAAADKAAEKEQTRLLAEQQDEQEAADKKATAEAEAIREQYRTPDEKAAKEREKVESLYSMKKLDDSERSRALADIEKDRVEENIDLADKKIRDAKPKLTDDQKKAKDIIEDSLTPRQRKEKAQAEIDRLYGKGLMSDDEKTQALKSLDKSQASVVGTFSGAALGGLSASTPLDAIKEATERTAKASEKTEANTRKKTTYT